MFKNPIYHFLLLIAKWKYPKLREGQALMNVLRHAHPAIFDKLVGSKLDPWEDRYVRDDTKEFIIKELKTK